MLMDSKEFFFSRPRVIDQDIEASMLLVDQRQRCFQVVRIRDIHRHGRGLHAELFTQVAGDRSALFRVPRTDDDIGPQFGERFAHRRPEVPRPAGDEHGLILQGQQFLQ